MTRIIGWNDGLLDRELGFEPGVPSSIPNSGKSLSLATPSTVSDPDVK